MPPESKEARFVRLAESRANKAIKTLRLIGNLANRNNYAYTEEQVERVFRVLQAELKTARRRFQDAASVPDDEFRL